ncbi:MAG: hypothetical protein EOP11_14925 [Proteobacteria bacterium]|nr:MAG: hypothetical protein EOP11_14925 [Pseudomonadota bacterium]
MKHFLSLAFFLSILFPGGSAFAISPLHTGSVPTDGRAAPKLVPSPEGISAKDAAAGPAPFSAPSPTEALAPPQVGTPKLMEVYGFFLPVAHYASGAIGSFGRPNMSAPTEAVLNGRSRGTFQVQQSRFGANFMVSSEVRAKLEVDFIDFSKASPSVQALPRLRILKIEYELAPAVILFAGQDWDIFSPLNAYGYNFVGGQFRGGNAGFMRLQAGAAAKFLGAVEAAGSLGFGNPNALENDQAQETEKQPVFSARVAYAKGPWRAGISGIYSRYGYYTNGPSNPIRTTVTTPEAYAGNLFAEGAFAGIEFRGEAYHGQNLANINLLTVGLGTPELPRVKESGAYLSAKYKWNKASFWTTLGFASIQDFERVNSATKGSSGLSRNKVFKFGADYGLGEKLRAFYELSLFRTTYFNGEAREGLHSVGLYLPI